MTRCREGQAGIVIPPNEEIVQMSEEVRGEKDDRGDVSDSLLMPVVDLVNVSKHNPVLPFHVLWNSLISHGGHVALHTPSHT